MSDADDEFESRLRELEPAPVSTELYARIEREAKEAIRQRLRFARGLMLTGCAALILLPAALVVRRFIPRIERIPTPVVVSPQPLSDPTIWAYREAAARSPQEFDAMLARDAKRLLPATAVTAAWPGAADVQSP